MAAVKSDGSVVTWGTAENGGDSSAAQANLQDIVRVVGNGRAFAALTATGGVVSWGKGSYGGAIPGELVADLASGVVSIHHTDRAFAALKSSGALVAWGMAGHGGGGAADVWRAHGVRQRRGVQRDQDGRDGGGMGPRGDGGCGGRATDVGQVCDGRRLRKIDEARRLGNQMLLAGMASRQRLSRSLSRQMKE
jgi:hypothetical protein